MSAYAQLVIIRCHVEAYEQLNSPNKEIQNKIEVHKGFLENQLMILKYFSFHRDKLIIVLKEFIIYMIINLSRVYKGFFEPTLDMLQQRIDSN